MKKKLLFTLVLIALLFISIGCNKKEESRLVGGWKTILTDSKVNLDDETTKIFNSAKKNYKKMELEPISLLAEQVVAGKNYMFLTVGYKSENPDNKKYKIVIVYNDLEGKSSITSVEDFNFTKFTHKNINNISENLSGGWTVSSPGKLNMLSDEEVQQIFEEENDKLEDISYNPIAIVGSQVVSGTNYAVLCFGKPADQEKPEGVYLITLYDGISKEHEIVSQAYIDLSKYNK